MKDIIIFDYDGVIADSLDFVIAIYNDLAPKYDLEKIKDKKEFTEFFNGNFFKGLDEAGIDPEVSEKFLKDMTDQLAEHTEKTPFFKGIKEVLEELSEKYELLIITSNLSRVVQKNLDQKGVAESIEKVIGADKEKSKTKKIKKVKEANPEASIYYVGDTTGDIYEGREAGAVTVAVTWGFHGRERLKSSSPDHLADTLEELTAIFLPEKGAVD